MRSYNYTINGPETLATIANYLDSPLWVDETAFWLEYEGLHYLVANVTYPFNRIQGMGILLGLQTWAVMEIAPPTQNGAVSIIGPELGRIEGLWYSFWNAWVLQNTILYPHPKQQKKQTNFVVTAKLSP